MKSYIAALVKGQDLSEEQSHEAMSAIMSGQATSAQIAGFLMALRLKGETVAEITGFATAMREMAHGVDVGGLDVVDTCGTGGDEKGTFNVSTASAIVTAAAGVPVAKHGNRSVSSSSGSADVLERLGVNIEAPVPIVEKCVREVGLGFLFAPLLHEAMKYAIKPRRELAVRTVFNILGPLTNPAGARRQVLGIFSADLVEMMAKVLHRMGARKAMVVHSRDGMDELSVCDESLVAEVAPDGVTVKTVDPGKLGLGPAQMDDLRVEGADQSAQVIRGVLDGKVGPARDMILLNAGAAIYVGGKAETLQEGIDTASQAIDSGRASEVLKRLATLSHSGE